jgi:hypothetical protein
MPPLPARCNIQRRLPTHRYRANLGRLHVPFVSTAHQLVDSHARLESSRCRLPNPPFVRLFTRNVKAHQTDSKVAAAAARSIVTAEGIRHIRL